MNWPDNINYAKNVLGACLVLSSTILDPRVGRSMDKSSPPFSIFRLRQQSMKRHIHPRADVVKPSHSRSSPRPCSWYSCLYDFLFQAVSLFPHQMPEVCKFPSFNLIE